MPRFSKSSDALVAALAFRVEDQDTITAPFSVRLTITEQPEYQLYEYSCHEGNTAVGQALSGERAYEKQVAEARAKGLPIPPRTTGMEVYSGAPVEGRQPAREYRVQVRCSLSDRDSLFPCNRVAGGGPAC